MVKLIVTDSLFYTFDCLDAEMSNCQDLDVKNIVFSEEKISLMTERFICAHRGGSFNTDVYSFGNFLARHKSLDKILSKEGASMAVKRVLSISPIKRLSKSGYSLAPKLSELIAQLKSANVTPEVIERGLAGAKGILREKLSDIACVYREYQKFIEMQGLEDQNSALAYLPEIIEKCQEIKGANVYIVGLSSITVQMRKIIEALIKSSANVTAILVGGSNNFAFVNETADVFRDIVARTSKNLKEVYLNSPYNEQSKIIIEGLFNPIKFPKQKISTEKIAIGVFSSVYQEVERVAEVIKYKVLSGECRYKDFVIATPDALAYKDALYHAFERLSVPYYLDQSKITSSHPLVLLICAYVESFRKNFDRESVKEFYKNPLFESDKSLTDDFDNYTLKFNISYNKLFTPFTLSEGEDLVLLEEFRQKVCDSFKDFDIFKMLSNLNVEKKLEVHAKILKEKGYAEESAVTSQIYQAVVKILREMQSVLGDEKISLWEFKTTFNSGISELKLSIIPQYSDAVFIGDYRECALVKAKNLFAIGLTSQVPFIQEDVALLNDNEINFLSQAKVLIEPKIRVVNHRMRESVALAISAFSDNLYLSYPTSAIDGSKTVKSEIITFIQHAFTFNSFPKEKGYLTHKQGLYSFSKECGEFADGKRVDFISGASFYHVDKTGKSEDIANRTNKQVKIRLNENQRAIISGITSPTGIEDFYACPYSAFLKHGLKLRERAESKVEGAFVGTLMHDIFKSYVSKVKDVVDRESSDQLFERITEKILHDVKYQSLKADAETSHALNRALNECKNYCYRTYLSFVNSKFKCDENGVEVCFGKAQAGENLRYPAISLLDGKIKLSGKIDRIDTCGDYFRILDYKTGGYNASSSALFNGTKLQLFLYSAAVTDKKLAGAYYLPVYDGFEGENQKQNYIAVGKTLEDEEVIKMQDCLFEINGGQSEYFAVKKTKNKISGAVNEKTLNDMVKYSLKISEKAVKQMHDGVIVASPIKTASQNACKYCEFYAMCYRDKLEDRQIDKVSEGIFSQALDEIGEND